MVKNKDKDKNNNNNSSNSLVFGRWPQTKTVRFDALNLAFFIISVDYKREETNVYLSSKDQVVKAEPVVEQEPRVQPQFFPSIRR